MINTHLWFTTWVAKSYLIFVISFTQVIFYDPITPKYNNKYDTKIIRYSEKLQRCAENINIGLNQSLWQSGFHFSHIPSCNTNLGNIIRVWLRPKFGNVHFTCLIGRVGNIIRFFWTANRLPFCTSGMLQLIRKCKWGLNLEQRLSVSALFPNQEFWFKTHRLTARCSRKTSFLWRIQSFYGFWVC